VIDRSREFVFFSYFSLTLSRHVPAARPPRYDKRCVEEGRRGRPILLRFSWRKTLVPTDEQRTGPDRPVNGRCHLSASRWPKQVCHFVTAIATTPSVRGGGHRRSSPARKKKNVRDTDTRSACESSRFGIKNVVIILLRVARSSR